MLELEGNCQGMASGREMTGLGVWKGSDHCCAWIDQTISLKGCDLGLKGNLVKVSGAGKVLIKAHTRRRDVSMGHFRAILCFHSNVLPIMLARHSHIRRHPDKTSLGK